jgi:DNA gyrase subunit A
MMVTRPDAFVFTATDGGFAKRTPVEEYPVQGRGGQGVLTAKLTDDRGGLVGALIVDVGDEVFAITSGGGVIRTRSDEVRPTSRATMGVRLINLGDGDAVVGVSRNAESADEGDLEGDVEGDLGDAKESEGADSELRDVVLGDASAGNDERDDVDPDAVDPVDSVDPEDQGES